MLALSNLAAAVTFVVTGLISWSACLPMMGGAVLGGWLGAKVGRKLSNPLVRAWTLLVTAGTTVAFFVRAYS